MPIQIALGPLGRLAAAELDLVAGRLLAGRVLERRGDHGLLLLAGTPLVARLPADLAAGTALRLRVASTTGEQAVLEVISARAASDADPPPAATTAAPPVAAPVDLPGGAALRVLPDGPDAGGRRGGPARTQVTLRLDGTGLGRVDLRVGLDSIDVHVAAGAPAQLARGAAAELSAALGGRPVVVHPRLTSVDRRA